jgi:hypothetical protein
LSTRKMWLDTTVPQYVTRIRSRLTRLGKVSRDCEEKGAAYEGKKDRKGPTDVKLKAIDPKFILCRKYQKVPRAYPILGP